VTATDVDLVVAGAGGGLVAALRAAELGRSVLVVEASQHYRRGNNTAMSTAMVPGAGTRWQAAAGVEDSPELFLADIMAKTHGSADLALARALTAASAEVVSWLADSAGLAVQLVTDFSYPGHAAHRCHTVPGRKGSAMLDVLARRVEAEPGADMLVPCRLAEVLPSAGPTWTVVLAMPDGGREEVVAGNVLLATNGFAADAPLVREHLPEIAAATYHGSPESRGDALRIGAALGAATGYLDSYQGHAALAQPAATLVGWATVMHGGFLVNSEGRRFGNETTGYSEYAAVLARQPGATGWIILDQRIAAACSSFQDFCETADSGALLWADDVSALAARASLPARPLADTMARAAALAEGEADADEFGRTSWGEPLVPPYAAVRVAPALFHTQGGLVVDAQARVLGSDGTPLPGLYAAGGAAIGISGHGAGGYLAGNGLLPAFGLSYLAAGAVAESG